MSERLQPLQEIVGIKPDLAAGISDMQIGGWEIKVSSEIRTFTKQNIDDGKKFLREWSPVFPREETYAQNTYGVPSVIVRLDCAVQDGELGIYEVEERPAGIGITTRINPDFANRLEKMKERFPDIASVVSRDERRKATDDSLWLPSLTDEDDETLVLVRAEPDEESFHYLESRSVSSLKMKGDKSYGETLGLWRKVTEVDELDFDEGFVLKPLRGSKTRDVFIYIPGPSSKRPPGASSRGKIEQTIFSAKENGGVYCQEYFPPMESGFEKEYKWMIYRVFYGYNTDTKDYECMGGTWSARYNLINHGARDTLSGAVVVEE